MPDQAFSEKLGVLEIFYLKKCCLSYKEQALTFCTEIFFTNRYSVVRLIMRTFQTKASKFCSLHKLYSDHHLHIWACSRCKLIHSYITRIRPVISIESIRTFFHTCTQITPCMNGWLLHIGCIPTSCHWAFALVMTYSIFFAKENNYFWEFAVV